MSGRICQGIILISILLIISVTPANVMADDHKTLAIGAAAPAFSLPGVDGKTYTLSSLKKAKLLVIIFTCNHCPTAQSYEDRIIKLTSDYINKNVAVVAIMPNDQKALRLDELDFSDLGDSFDDMKTRAKEKHFNFPYLYDGEKESVSMAYGPVATPHVFIFDGERKLRYCGRFDDTESHDKIPRSNDAQNAIEALLNDKDVPVKTTKVFGCSVKWSDKRPSVQQALNKWAKEPVKADTIGATALKNILKNTSDKLRLIYIWTTKSVLSTKQFPEFITIHRMYRDRDFEFTSINADGLMNKSKTFKFLQGSQASNHNYILDHYNKRTLAEAINPEWDGTLPYTLLVEPGGKIIYTKQGVVHPPEVKKIIVENHLIGRYP